MLNVKIGDKDQDDFVSVIVSEGSEDGPEVAAWGVSHSKAYESIVKHGYNVVEYLGNGNFSASRVGSDDEVPSEETGDYWPKVMYYQEEGE